MKDRFVLRLEIDANAEPLEGRLSSEAGVEVEFSGWIGLAAALERVMASAVTGRTEGVSSATP